MSCRYCKRNKTMNGLQILFLLYTLMCTCKSYKILAVLPMPMHSHYTLSSILVDELVSRGHEVTFVTPFPRHKDVENLKEVSVEAVISALDGVKKQLYNLNDLSVFGSVQFLTKMGYIMTEDVLKNSNVQQLLQSKEKYDVVIIPQFLNEGLLGIGCHYKTPVVLIAPMPLFAWGSFVLGLPSPSSYVPNLLTPYTGHMDFWQRFYNTFYDICSILYHQYIILPKHRELVRRYIPTKPDLYSFLNNASLLLVNSHVSSYDATLQVPNVVEIGGLHIKEPKKLPHDLQEFLDNSKNGVILFSMGSNLKSSSLDGKKRNAILGAFSKLKEKVLWKWENDSLPGQPKNVRLMKWVPQCDVLAHPNVKIFITHGGLFSTMESIYHGVPAIGIPVFSDQKLNMATAVSNGYALVVPFDKLTESKLSNAINEVLNNPKYKNNAMKRSKIIKDRPVKPLDHAIYSIEYVIRHQGASHLRYSGMDLNWYQRNVLDVVGLVLITLVATLCLICIALKKICNLWLTEERIIKKMN